MKWKPFWTKQNKNIYDRNLACLLPQSWGQGLELNNITIISTLSWYPRHPQRCWAERRSCFGRVGRQRVGGQQGVKRHQGSRKQGKRLVLRKRNDMGVAWTLIIEVQHDNNTVPRHICCRDLWQWCFQAVWSLVEIKTGWGCRLLFYNPL